LGRHGERQGHQKPLTVIAGQWRSGNRALGGLGAHIDGFIADGVQIGALRVPS